MQDVIVAFAHTGNPATATLPDWPAYDAGRRSTMVFDLQSKLVEDPYPGVRKVVQSLGRVGL